MATTSVGSHGQPCEYAKFVRRLTDALTEDIDRPQILQDLLEDFFQDLLHCSPFHQKEKSNTDRQSIISGKIEKYPNLPALTDEQKMGILTVSDVCHANELSCLDYWISASDQNTRRWLEQDLDEIPGTYENQLSSTVITLIEHDRLSLLEAMSVLFKARHDSNLSQVKKNVVKYFTNRLIKLGIISQLIQALVKGCTDRKLYRSTTFVRECLMLLAENLFLASYKVHVTLREYESLIDFIQQLSEIVSSDQSTDKTSEDWRLYPMLAILQVTQISVLEQTCELYDRDAKEEDSYDIGNRLYQTAESQDGLDRPWKGGKGVKGVGCLAHAILRQPLVDIGRADSSEVIWFFKEAYQNRAYSYIRLCLIPLIQSRNVGHVDIQPLLCSVLNEFFRNLYMIITLPVYRFQHESGYPFFPDEQQSPDGAFLDTFEDFLRLTHDFAMLWPKVSDCLWAIDNSHAHHPFLQFVVRAASKHMEYLMATSWKFLASLSGGSYAVNANHVYNFMRLNHRHQEFSWTYVFNAIENVAGSLNSQSITQTTGGRYVDGIGTTGSEGISRVVSTPGLNFADIDALLAILELIGSVVKSSEVARNLVADGYQPIQKVSSLIPCVYVIHGASAMESIEVGIEIRGRVFEIIGYIVRANPSIVEEVWDFLESKQVLPLKGSGFDTIANKSLTSWRGVREDLEDAETKTKKYHVTESFLLLLHSLIVASHSTDDDGNAQDIAIENATVYLDYIIDDVLFKASSRQYAPEGSAGAAQEYRILYRCLSILVAILQQYNPSNTNDYEEDFTIAAPNAKYQRTSSASFSHWSESRTASKAKSLGFHVMSMLLGQSRLLQKVISILQTCTLSACQTSIQKRGDDASKDAVEIMQKTRLDSQQTQSTSYWTSLHDVTGAKKDQTKKLDQEPDLTSYSMASTSCDCSYWQEMSAQVAIGLLYECMLREKRFMELFRRMKGSISAMETSFLSSSSQSKNYLSNDFQNRPLIGFAEIMCNMAILNAIVPFISISSTGALIADSNPSIAVMAIKLIEYVASYAPSKVVIGALLSSRREELELQREFVSALLLNEEDVLIPIKPQYDEIPPISEPLGGMEPVVAYTMKSYNWWDNIDDPKDFMRKETRRDAILSLFINSLKCNGSNVGLSHYLLGYRSWMTDEETNSDTNCFDAILSLMNSSFIRSNPSQAPKLYQILYLLITSSHSLGNASGPSPVADYVVKYLHDEKSSAMITQLELFCDLWHDLWSNSLSNMETATTSRFQLKSSLLSCCHWLLLTIAHIIQYSRTKDQSSMISSDILSLWMKLLSLNRSISTQRDDMLSLQSQAMERSRYPLLSQILFSTMESGIVLSIDTAKISLNTIKSKNLLELIDKCAEMIPKTHLDRIDPTAADTISSDRSKSTNLYRINVESFKKLAEIELKTGSHSSTSFRSIGQFSQQSYSSEEYHVAMQAIYSYNSQQKQLVASIDFIRSWQQVISILFAKISSDYFDRSHEATSYSQSMLFPRQDTKKHEVSLNLLQYVINSMFLPFLSMLETCVTQSLIVDANQSYDMAMAPSILDDLAISTLSMVTGICQALITMNEYHVKTSDDEASIMMIFPVEQYGDCVKILAGTIKQLHLRHVTSVATRGYLHIAFTKLLQYPRLCHDLFVSRSVKATVERIDTFRMNIAMSPQYQENENGITTQEGLEAVQSYMDTWKTILPDFAVDLVDVLCHDSIEGLVETRLTAMAALISLLQCINVNPFIKPISSSMTMISPIYEACIALMDRKGYVTSILSYLDRKKLSYSSTTRMNENVVIDFDVLDQEELIRSTIAICQQLSYSSTGINILLASSSHHKNIFVLLSSLNLIAKYPLSTVSDNIMRYENSKSIKQQENVDEALEYISLTILPVLQLLATIGSICPSQEVYHGLSSLLLHDWRGFIHDILSFKLKSSLGLQLIEITLQILQLLAGQSEKEREMRDVLNITENDALKRDLKQLLILFGEKLSITIEQYQELSLASNNLLVDSNSSKSWLMSMEYSFGSTIHPDDMATVAYALKILAHLASYYRIEAINSSSSAVDVMSDENKSSSSDDSLESYDTSLLVRVFSSCCEKYMNLVSEEKKYSQSSRQLVSLLQSTYGYVTENIICAIAAHTQRSLLRRQLQVLHAGGFRSQSGYDHGSDLIKAIAQSESFPTSSFVRQIGRWLKDHVY